MGLLTVLHILGAILLIVLVLVQDSKGAMGSSFGGSSSSQSILGPTGAPNFLFKATRWVVLIFAATSILLSKLSAEKSSSVLDGMTTPPPAAATLPVAPETNTAPDATPVKE